MKIGISLASNYSVTNVRDGAAHMIARAKAANTAGLDSLFVGDHHVVPSPYYQNTPMLGRLLAEWDARPAGALYLLPLWNPVLLAEQTATLACIHPGPFILQCGLGRGRQQFEAMGTDIRFRPSAFEESLAILRALWAGETVSGTRRFDFTEARIAPVPPQKIEVWIGASAPVAIDRAARLGDAWLADPGLTRDDAARALDTYRDALARHDRNADVVAIRRDIYVAESSADATAVRKQIEADGYRGFDPAALMIGEAQQVAEQMQAFEQLGYTDIIVRNLHPDPGRALESTKRLRQVKLLTENFFA